MQNPERDTSIQINDGTCYPEECQVIYDYNCNSDVTSVAGPNFMNNFRNQISSTFKCNKGSETSQWLKDKYMLATCKDGIYTQTMYDDN